jgi:heterodisulfide reductase subunit B
MALVRPTWVAAGVSVSLGRATRQEGIGMKEFAVFWGCTIPARFPFIEKATRVMFDDLGATVHELEGHTCCPEGTLVKANDPETFYTAAARNLALIEKAGLDVVTPCNGCYSTFKEAQSHLRADWRERDIINERLAREDLEYTGDLKVVHFAEWLADEMGAGLIASKATKPFWGMRLAVHYGCHLLRPQPAVRWDDPLHPTKVEEIVAALGARVVDYTTKMQCCGGALDRVGQRDSSLAFCRRKLYDLQENEVDALIVVCPSCFQQFDLNQAALQRANEPVDVPVLYLSELIDLAYGHEPEEIGLDMHRVSVEPFLEKWGARTQDKERLSDFFDVAMLGKCYSCQACKDDCPVCKVDPAFQPTEIIGELLRGNIDEVLADEQLWKCVECYTCHELCHSDIGMAETFRRLKELAITSGSGPESVSESFRTFLETGALGKPREGARKKLGLEPLPTGGGDAVARIFACDLDDESPSEEGALAEEGAEHS